MRLFLAALLLAVVSPPGAAQGVPRPRGWSVAVGAERIRFNSVARDTAAPAEQEAELRPSSRGGLRITLDRAFGPWRVQLEAGWAEGATDIALGSLVVNDETLDLSRYRLAPGVERKLTGVGSGELAAALVPTLDLWRVDGQSRLRPGLEGRLTVRVPLGAVELENRLAAGLSGGPLDFDDLGEDFERYTLRTVTFGAAIRIPL